MDHNSQPERSERGLVVVIVAAALAAIMALAALVIDLGNVRQERRQAQASSDGAALAGAIELPLASPDPIAADAAMDAAAANLGINEGDGSTPPTVSCGGSVPANATCYAIGDVTAVVATPYTLAGSTIPAHNLIYVEVCQPTPTYFAQAIGQSSPTTCREAVARRRNASGGFGYGLVSLHPSRCQALQFRGDSSTTLSSNGAVMVNSNCPGDPGALDASGASWDLVSSFVGVVGNATLAPCAPPASTSCTTTVPTEGIPTFTDPLAHVVEPSRPSTSPTSHCSWGGPGDTRVVEPGYYPAHCTFGSSKTFIFRPGLYYFQNGFSSNSSAALLCANAPLLPTAPGSPCDGVTFFLATGSSTMNGSAAVDLPPPSSGPYAGISIFQSRSNTSVLTINGTTDFNIGTIYAPNADPLNVLGTGEVEVTGMVIALTIDIGGTFDFTIDVPVGGPAAPVEDDIGLEN